MNICGVTDAMGFQNATRTVINMHGIEPWPARELIKDNLQRQAQLAQTHPFNQIPVETGMAWYNDRVGGMFTKLTRDVFVDQGVELMVQSRVRHNQGDRNRLYDIFDAMDFDSNGELSIGEWAGGLTVFFKGNMEECVHACFDCLDRNGDKSLSRYELQEYLAPFVNAMTPPEAAALRPLLLKRAAQEIYDEMDFDHNDAISSDEMIKWSKDGNNIVDRIATLIEHEVYQIWLADKDAQQRKAYSQGYRGRPPANAYPPPPQPYQNQNQQPYGAPNGGYGGYGGGYNAGYSNQDPNDYRNLPKPPPAAAPWDRPPGPGYGSFTTPQHQDSAWGGGY